MRFSLVLFILSLGFRLASAQLFQNGASVLTQDTSKKINHYVVQPFQSISRPTFSSRKVIVRLKSDPLIKTSKGFRAARIQSLESEHEKFKSDLAQLGKGTAQGRTTSAKIFFEYNFSLKYIQKIVYLFFYNKFNVGLIHFPLRYSLT